MDSAISIPSHPHGILPASRSAPTRLNPRTRLQISSQAEINEIRGNHLNPHTRTSFFKGWLTSNGKMELNLRTPVQVSSIFQSRGCDSIISISAHPYKFLRQICTRLTRTFIHFSENPYVCLVDGYSRLLVNRRFHRPTSVRNLQSFMSDSLSHHGG